MAFLQGLLQSVPDNLKYPYPMWLDSLIWCLHSVPLPCLLHTPRSRRRFHGYHPPCLVRPVPDTRAASHKANTHTIHSPYARSLWPSASDSVQSSAKRLKKWQSFSCKFCYTDSSDFNWMRNSNLCHSFFDTCFLRPCRIIGTNAWKELNSYICEFDPCVKHWFVVNYYHFINWYEISSA